jgi:hypothetical protein
MIVERQPRARQLAGSEYQATIAVVMRIVTRLNCRCQCHSINGAYWRIKFWLIARNWSGGRTVERASSIQARMLSPLVARGRGEKRASSAKVPPSEAFSDGQVVGLSTSPVAAHTL